MSFRVRATLFLVLISLFQTMALARDKSESHYQEKFCQSIGKSEVRLKDGTRVDCLTSEYAIEIDFADKWYEVLGQSLHYSRLTGKKAAIGLILEKTGDSSKLIALEKTIKHF